MNKNGKFVKKRSFFPYLYQILESNHNIKKMSFQNSYAPDGSININVVPSFGHVVVVPESLKYQTVQTFA